MQKDKDFQAKDEDFNVSLGLLFDRIQFFQ